MSEFPTPRVSILIPNYNNGAKSSRDGSVNLILDLLNSLESTLKNDPTPFEILAYDDGSNDDSLDTLRQWSKKTWSDGRPFLELTEDEHCGILAITANKLSRMAKGDILSRLDGDVICLTENWVSKLVEYMDQPIERLGIIGPKQLKPNLKIHAYGDFVVHPNGYIHYANNLPRHSVKRPLEVDHVMGCFYCCKKAVFNDIGGYDEDFLRGQTIDFGLRARKAGWRAFAVPDIEFIHNHVKREDRNTRADTNEGLAYTMDVFNKKWGFSRLAPDMDKIAKDYEGSPLLWNKHFFGATAYKPRMVPAEQIDFTQSDWARYAKDEAFQAKINIRMQATIDVIKQTKLIPKPLVIVGQGDGLFTHLFAAQGGHALTYDDRPGHVAFARKCTANQKYPGERPVFKALGPGGTMDLPDASVDQLLIDSILERYPNPTVLIQETVRVLKPGALMVVVSNRRPVFESEDPTDPATFVRLMTTERHFVWMELVNLVKAAGGRKLDLAIDIFKDNPARDMVLIVRRNPD